MAERTLEEILVNLRKRVALLERGNSHKGMTFQNLRAVIRQVQASGEWGAKSGANFYLSAYKVAWARGIDSGGSINARESANYIRITQPGIYEVRAVMRGGASGNANFIALSLNGDRGALENRSADQATMVGVWTHSHPGAANDFTESVYLGQLYAGDLLAAGPSTDGTDIPFGPGPTTGGLFVRRIS
jgi:hypothetical protein